MNRFRTRVRLCPKVLDDFLFPLKEDNRSKFLSGSAIMSSTLFSGFNDEYGVLENHLDIFF